MKLRYVSITGADDAVSVADLNELGKQYPFIEWALLLMPEEMGGNRCPSAEWIGNFLKHYKGEHKAMHLCGSALLDFIENKAGILDLMKGFHRIQLNLEFGNVEGKYDPGKLLEQMKAHPEFEFVIQYTDKRKNFLPHLRGIPNHALLFDGSAGRGVSPKQWPAPVDGHFCGYAGGISPDNVQMNLKNISQVAFGHETWIDMESGVRTADRFDLEKVRRVLEFSAPFAV